MLSSFGGKPSSADCVPRAYVHTYTLAASKAAPTVVLYQALRHSAPRYFRMAIFSSSVAHALPSHAPLSNSAHGWLELAGWNGPPPGVGTAQSALRPRQGCVPNLGARMPPCPLHALERFGCTPCPWAQALKAVRANWVGQGHPRSSSAVMRERAPPHCNGPPARTYPHPSHPPCSMPLWLPASSDKRKATGTCISSHLPPSERSFRALPYYCTSCICTKELGSGTALRYLQFPSTTLRPSILYLPQNPIWNGPGSQSRHSALRSTYLASVTAPVKHRL